MTSAALKLLEDTDTPDIRAIAHMLSDEVLLTEEEVAAICGFDPSTLRNQRHKKRSVFPYTKLANGSIRYPMGALRAALKAATSEK